MDSCMKHLAPSKQCALVTERRMSGSQHLVGGVAGAKGPAADVNRVAELTVKALLRTVPPAVPGVMFLSGGQACPHADTLHAQLVCLQ